MVLLIDNYDSFTYNLFQYLAMLGAKVRVFRNDAITLREIEKMKPTHIVISPGPGYPRDAGVSLEVIDRMAGRTPILGVCLGHQAIAEAFGAVIVRAPRLMHGKASAITHDGRGVYRGLPNPLSVVRYHSLVADPETIPSCISVTSRTSDGIIMGIRHKRFKVEGVQFHPESFLTEHGMAMLKNFLKPRNK
ncbi:MAG: aminodeoxychorismate/anthranilate synthase component II [Oligoflexales bacterium]|nr:aminodeoxychorismate/anthranilate synthase component II [Oligoflexales bacterium]